MQDDLVSGDYQSERKFIINLVTNHFGENKDVSILDFGCGSGISVLLFLLLGYKNVKGVDVVKKFSNELAEKLEFPKDTFDLVEDQLPYPDKKFDLIISSQVVEHVKNFESYYQEAARVLKYDRVFILTFPHKHQLYDTHSRTFFIHWFPEKIRKMLYDIFSRQGGEYLYDYLYLRSISEHKNISKKYFSSFKNIRKLTIKDFNPNDYKSFLSIRILADKLMKLKYFGKFFTYIISYFASATIILKK